jgi:dTMP kinase
MLLTFEGIDGSGKSTQVQRLAERVEAAGYAVLRVREPGGTELSERIRSLLLDPSLHVVPQAELLLFSAARAQLVAERIRPALAAGQVVLCDRFYDSTTAYQGAGRALQDLDWLRAFNLRVTGGLVPDRTYLIEVPLATALARRRGRLPTEGRPEQDRMEAGGQAFFEAIGAAYARLAGEEPARILRLDGTLPADVLHEQIWADVHPRLPHAPGTPASG